MKVKLITDFWDYYDHEFDLEGETFKRKSQSGMNRIEMFKFLEYNWIWTVPNGYTKDLITEDDIKSNKEFVIYTDINAHRAEGKMKVSAQEAVEKYSDNYCSAYDGNNFGISYRRLQIGNIVCWLKYQSKNWRSNYGDVNIEVTHVLRNNTDVLNFKYPLSAIDYIQSYLGVLYAVDFNIAPQIKGTGLEDIITAKEVAEQIKRKMEVIKN
jgi:hypothetical protein